MNAMEVQTKSRSLELKKNVAAIHSSSSLTLVQRKIANALLYNAYNELLTKDSHTIHIKTLCDLIGYNSKDFAQIKKSLIKLISTVIEWNLVDRDRIDSGGVWNASAIIADASIDGAWCTYSYSGRMRELLYRPELYGKLNLAIQAKFKSTYGLALYENCIRYERIPYTPWVTMEVFRKLMGVYDNKYLLFRDFKKRVIDQAVEEVNAFAPIEVFPKYKKERKNVVAIQFLIQRKKSILQSETNFLLGEKNEDVVGAQVLEESSEEKTSTDKDALNFILCSRFGFSPIQAKKIIKAYSEDYILGKISLVESTETFKSGRIANLAKYLTSALKEDFQPPKSSIEFLKAKQAHEAKQKSLTEIQTKLHGKYDSKYREYKNKKILQNLANLSLEQKSEIERNFEKQLGTTVYHSTFVREGFKNFIIREEFSKFVRQNYKDLLSGMIGFQEFCDEQEKVLET